MEIKIINSIDSLNAIAKELMNGNYIFRGTSGKEDILPNLIRHGKDLSSKEIDILNDFERYYGIYATANTPWEFLGLAQHSWLYTRLIDFSANLFVALFFSLHNNKQDAVYKVYVFEKNKLGVIDSILRGGWTIKDTTLVFDDDVQVDQSYASLLKEEFEKLDDNFYLLEPNYRNSRMLMQQGLFVVPSP